MPVLRSTIHTCSQWRSVILLCSRVDWPLEVLNVSQTRHADVSQLRYKQSPLSTKPSKVKLAFSSDFGYGVEVYGGNLPFKIMIFEF